MPTIEKICGNCEYFNVRGFPFDEYRWGDCVKPEKCTTDKDGRKKGVFTWNFKSCDEFKPKQQLKLTSLPE